MRRALLTLSVLGLLCGCAAQFQAQDNVTCQNAGAMPGTDNYTNCMMLMFQARQARIQQQAAALQNFGNALQQAGAASQPIYPARPLMCQSYQQGYYTNTTCQ